MFSRMTYVNDPTRMTYVCKLIFCFDNSHETIKERRMYEKQRYRVRKSVMSDHRMAYMPLNAYPAIKQKTNNEEGEII